MGTDGTRRAAGPAGAATAVAAATVAVPGDRTAGALPPSPAIVELVGQFRRSLNDLLDLPALRCERRSVDLQGPTKSMLLAVRIDAVLKWFAERDLDPGDRTARARLAAELGLHIAAVDKILAKRNRQPGSTLHLATANTVPAFSDTAARRAIGRVPARALPPSPAIVKLVNGRCDELDQLLRMPSLARQRRSVELQHDIKGVLHTVRVDAALRWFAERALDPNDRTARERLADEIGVDHESVRKLLANAPPPLDTAT